MTFSGLNTPYGLVEADFSSASQPYGNTYRGIGSSIFNANSIAREDYVRSQQAADSDLMRSLELLAAQNEFSSSESQKQRDYEERLSNTAYQRAVQDMKAAGINPILAFSQGGSGTPSGSSASSGSGGSVSSYRPASNSDALSSILHGVINIISGFIGKL